MSDYGLEVYCGDGIKLLSTAEMGVAFPLVGAGNFSYATAPNSLSQVEFPRSPVIGGWPESATNESIKQVFDSMPHDWVPAPIWSTVSSYRGSSAPWISYGGNHISGCSEPVLGLSNTLNGGTAPATPELADTYGVFAKDSLVNLASTLNHLVLVKVETLSGLSFPAAYWTNMTGFRRTPQLLVVPLLTANTTIALKTIESGVSVGLLARTPNYEVYILHCDSSAPCGVRVYTYDTLDVAVANNPSGHAEYGIEVFEGNAVRFSSRHPPLLPVFVSTYQALNNVPAQDVRLACVFSSISMVTQYIERSRRVDEEINMVFNGVKWESDGKMLRARMGFASRTKMGKSVSGATLSRMVSFDEAYQPSNNTVLNTDRPGAFMTVTAY